MLTNQIIYQIFVRNYSKEGTFFEVEKDLQRIKDLGTDIIYLMPIHEIGIKNRKGKEGSPYAIKDYFSINKDYGTKEDFISLIDHVHDLDMKIIIDMVFNHTSPDNVLIKEHPEYYYYKNGKLGNRVGDWSDVVDLDTYREDTQEYLLSVLKYWVSLGVDGFRFDVASMIPLPFFKKARKELREKIIFIGESIDYGFSNYLTSIGDNPNKDEDMFPTFDSLYNYSWFDDFDRFIKGKEDIESLVNSLNNDAKLLYRRGIRLNCIENHDRDRIASIVSKKQLKEIIRFFSHLKGQLFIYMGQEYGNSHKPNLFEKDPVDWMIDDDMLNEYRKAIKRIKEHNNMLDIKQEFKAINQSTIELCEYLDNELIFKDKFSFV